MKQFLVLIVAAIAMMVTWAPLSARAEDNDNCKGCPTGQSCERWLGEWTCVTVCCDDTKCSGQTCYKRSAGQKFGVCVDDDGKVAADEWYAKAAASANAAALRDAKKALEDASAALKAAEGDAEQTRLALLKVLEAEYRLADLDLAIAKAESAEAGQTWESFKEAAVKNGALHKQWDTLKGAKDVLDAKITALTGTMATANSLISAQPANAKIEPIQTTLADLQNKHGELKVALADLQVAHKAIKGEQERDFTVELDAERQRTVAAKAEATGLRPHEISVLGFLFNILETEEMEDSRSQTAFGRLVYRHHWRLKETWRPFFGGGFEAGSLLDGRGYAAPVAELGFRAGNPSKVFYFEMWVDGGYRVGFYEGSGHSGFVGGGLGPGFNLGDNKGTLMFGACYSSSSPGFNGHKADIEDNILGICVRGSGSAGDPE